VSINTGSAPSTVTRSASIIAFSAKEAPVSRWHQRQEAMDEERPGFHAMAHISAVATAFEREHGRIRHWGANPCRDRRNAI
jgi:hypothetical protein